MQQCVSHAALTLTVLVQKYTPCQGVVWSQYRVTGTFYVPLGFGVVLFTKVCFFLPAQFYKAVAIDFTLALLYPNFKVVSNVPLGRFPADKISFVFRIR